MSETWRIRLPKPLRIRGRLYEAGEYEVPEEIEPSLARWILARGLGEEVAEVPEVVIGGEEKQEAGKTGPGKEPEYRSALGELVWRKTLALKREVVELLALLEKVRTEG